MPMHRLYSHAAVVTWSIAVLLFVIALLEDDVRTHYSFYLFGLLIALFAVTFTCLGALDRVVGEAIAREVEMSRQMLAQAVARALVDELEERGEVTPFRSRR